MHSLTFSDWLPKVYPSFWKALSNVLENHQVDFQLVKPTRDIWVRDYMPVRNAKGEWVRFVYYPEYLKKAPSYRTTPQEVHQCMANRAYLDCPLVVDGGNVVIVGDKVILTDALYAWNEKFSRSEIDDIIKEALKVEQLIIIPSYPGDGFRHADGVVAKLDDQRVFVIDDSKYSTYGNELSAQLTAAGLKSIPVPFYDACEEEAADEQSAKGNYLNFLETEQVVLIPQYGIAMDAEAMKIYKRSFSKPCIGIDCRDVAAGGGALHCVSWS